MPTYSITYNVSDLRAKVDEEVSKAAQRAVNKDGQALYDLVKIHSNDRNQIEGLIRDAMHSVALRFSDLSTLQEAGGMYALYLNAPDSILANDIVESEITRYVTMKVVASWLVIRYPDYAKYYADIADDALAKVVVAVRTRMKPTR